VDPIAPQPVLSALSGVLAGLVLAGGAVVLLEFLDISVRTPAQITSLARAASVPSVVAVPRMRRHGDLFILSQPQSSAAESIRMLGSAVDAALAQRSTNQIVATSAGSDTSNTLIMANLGVALAQMGRRVALVDTDYRDPTLHKIFAAHNARGLSTMLRSADGAWRSATIDVNIPNLILIPSGPAPERPDQQLNAVRLQRLRSLLGEIAGTVDVLLIGVPPILAAGGPIVGATKADSALVICRGGRTSRDSLAHSLNSLLDMDVPVLGIVIS
jgi:Mrp family chromosome partitioning ATPase